MMPGQPLVLAPFLAKDYLTYRSWFADPGLRAALGTIDREWLDYVLQEEDGQELAVFTDGQLVAVIGVKIPKGEGYYVVSNLAVKPELRKAGWGSKALRAVLGHYNLLPTEYWVAYVDKVNLPARQFFQKQGWRQTEDEGDEEMLRFAWKPD